ncbi:MAG: SLBB domain-containing protein [Alloprevotella sp.]|nr:SLBB domain-containing protein [Alloprevotella sp.]
MKKIFFLLLAFAVLPAAEVWAQSTMTDSQIMEFIIKENEKGTARQDIMTKLVERGVTVDRIRKIRRNYDRQRQGTQPGALDISGYDRQKQDRMRVNNGQTRREMLQREQRERQQDENSYRRRRLDDGGASESNMTERQRRLMRERQMDDMESELDFVLPDTLEMFDDIMGTGPRKKKKEKEVFGRNIFSNRKLTFESDMNIATPADYRLGAGDVVYVDVWGASQKNYETTVTPDGSIVLEGFGPVHVAGMSVDQANRHLRSTLGARYQSSNIRLTVGQTKTITVNVMGEVRNPGTFTLSAFSTVFHALYMAGGTNEIGTLRNIKIYRNNREISTVDIYDYILNGKMTGNVRLASGDVIVVGPYECLVQVAGKVRRPMYYEMKPTESVGTVLKYAGGFTGEAYQALVTLVRKSGGQYSVYTLDEFERNGFQVKDADSLFVDSTLNRYENMVEVKGFVFRPGKFQMDGNISSVRQLVEAAGGPKEEALVNHVVMRRRKDDRTLEVLSIDLQALMEHKLPDIPLRNEDELYVPGKNELQSELTLTIQGEVMYPGEYEYAENMSVEDFILLAGGLRDAASTVKVDVSRRIRNNRAYEEGESIAQSFSFELSEGFMLRGDNKFKLEPFDEVFVRRSPGYSEQQHVRVEGEVAFEGIYTLTRKASRLSDLIREAGGLTREAYAKGARLERKLTPEEKLNQQTMLKVITAGDSTNLAKVELGDFKPIGINLDMALANPGNDQWDIVLRADDRVVIPQYNNTVSINGEVMYPNTVAYKDGESLRYYINQAGGYGQQARKSHVFAVNMNGTVTKVKHARDIQPGSSLVVPAKARRRGLSFGEIISLSTMGVSLSAVLATLLK